MALVLGHFEVGFSRQEDVAAARVRVEGCGVEQRGGRVDDDLGAVGQRQAVDASFAHMKFGQPGLCVIVGGELPGGRGGQQWKGQDGCPAEQQGRSVPSLPLPFVASAVVSERLQGCFDVGGVGFGVVPDGLEGVVFPLGIGRKDEPAFQQRPSFGWEDAVEVGLDKLLDFFDFHVLDFG